MTSRDPVVLLAALFLCAGAAAAEDRGTVSIRVLDEPIEDLRAYAAEAVSLGSKTAPAESMNQVAGRSTGTTDVLLVPYYESDRRSSTGVNTMFAIRNETGHDLPVRVLYLSALGAAEQAVQEIELPAHATRTINLRDVPRLPADEDGVARGLVVLGVVGSTMESSDLLSGDFFFVDPATDYATGNSLLNMSLDDTGNEFCAEWGTRFFRGGGFAGASSFRFVVDVPGGGQGYDAPTAVGTIYDEAGTAVRSFEIRTDLNSFELSSEQLAPEEVPFGSLSIRFPETKGAILVEHSGFHRLSVALKAACRDDVPAE